MTYGVTKRQAELLKFLKEQTKDGGATPSYDEMKDALGLQSKSGVHRLIVGLEERGLVARMPYRQQTVRPL